MHPTRPLTKQRPWLGEHWGVCRVERASDVSGQLQVLQLILPHWNMGGSWGEGGGGGEVGEGKLGRGERGKEQRRGGHSRRRGEGGGGGEGEGMAEESIKLLFCEWLCEREGGG